MFVCLQENFQGQLHNWNWSMAHTMVISLRIKCDGTKKKNLPVYSLGASFSNSTGWWENHYKWQFISSLIFFNLLPHKAFKESCTIDQWFGPRPAGIFTETLWCRQMYRTVRFTLCHITCSLLGNKEGKKCFTCRYLSLFRGFWRLTTDSQERTQQEGWHVCAVVWTTYWEPGKPPKLLCTASKAHWQSCCWDGCLFRLDKVAANHSQQHLRKKACQNFPWNCQASIILSRAAK